MLNRRYLRIKVLQALYAFWQDDKRDLNIKEKELISSIDKIYELYIYLFLLLREIRRLAEKINDERKKRLRPAPEDLNPNTRFEKDPVLLIIDSSPVLLKQKNARKIGWASDEDALIRTLFNTITSSSLYKTYMDEPSATFEKSKDFISAIYKKYISDNEQLKHHLSDKNMHWIEDCHLAHICVVKTIKDMHSDSDLNLMPLYKADDDRDFMLTLFRQTILDNDKNSAIINQKISNWEPDRIAAMDMLLMKMAITEIMFFPEIPVKASLNEYIELSKNYSSPKSNTFINGILDAIVKDLKKENKLKKMGRGLLE